MPRRSNIVSFEAAKRKAGRHSRIGKDSRPAASAPASPGTVRHHSLEAIFRMDDDLSDADFEPAAMKPAAMKPASMKAAADPAKLSKPKPSKQELKQARKKAKAKAKADKMFNKAYDPHGAGSMPGGVPGAAGSSGANATSIFGRIAGAAGFGKSSAQAQSDAGPRAAVYKGEMGSRQKRASKIQEKASSFSAAHAGRVSKSGRNGAHEKKDTTRKAANIAFIAVFITFVCISVYVPAQQYYVQMRERDRLAAEYDAIQERNDALTGIVNNLQSQSGVEDKAHSEFGLVKKDEESASVIGIDVDDSLDFVANVAPGSVPAPDTWYSGVLDAVFGYNRR